MQHKHHLMWIALRVMEVLPLAGDGSPATPPSPIETEDNAGHWQLEDGSGYWTWG